MNVVSLFSGLGGLDKGFADTGYNIVWAYDFDKYAVQTYKANFGDRIVLGDINEIPLEIIPDCDILIGGFPCQPFSMMGQQKGFEDTRGTLFFRIAEIVDDKINIHPSFPLSYSICYLTGNTRVRQIRYEIKTNLPHSFYCQQPWR